MYRKKKILVADDNHSIVRLLEVVLRQKGYAVLRAYTGNEALDKALEEKPDLIILDVVMPDKDGYEVCRYLHNHPDTEKIPVIMLTVKGQVNALPTDLKAKKIMEERIEERRKGFEAGAIEFLSKPIVVSEVLAQVKRVLNLYKLG